MAVRGPDVSNNNALPNWAKVRSSGARFGGAKATEGLTFNDSHFPYNWREMRRAGLIRIAYHFGHADSGRSAVAEARHFIAYVNDCGGFRDGDIACLDVELGNLRGAALDRWVNSFCAEVEKHLGRPGLIYSGSWFLGARGAKLTQPRKRGWKLWSAAYGPRPVTFSGFVHWLLWQFTDGRYGPQPHSMPGIGACDISVASSWADLIALGGHSVPNHAPASRTLKLDAEGTDVIVLQHGLNHRLTARNRHPIKVTGTFDKATAAALHFAMYYLGFPLGTVKKSNSASSRVQALVEHPEKRPASYLARAVVRAGRSNPK